MAIRRKTKFIVNNNNLARERRLAGSDYLDYKTVRLLGGMAVADVAIEPTTTPTQQTV